MTRTIQLMNTSPRFRRVRTVALVLCTLGLALWGYIYMCNSSYVHSYAVYSERAELHAQAAFLPGSVANGVRQELNQVLADVLSKPMSASERSALAQRGLQLLKDSDAQVDAIAEKTNAVTSAIADVEESARRLGNLRTRESRLEIANLARKAESAIEDIRGLSYRSNFHTAEIFTRVLTDGGELTRDYVIQLNEQIPQLEQQFNRRSNLYVELESLRGKLAQLYADIEG